MLRWRAARAQNSAVAGLTADDWKRVLTRLSDELAPPGRRRIIVIGGVAMALGYGSRRTTADADSVMDPDVAAEVLPAAKRIAGEFGLADDWLKSTGSRSGQDRSTSAPRTDGL